MAAPNPESARSRAALISVFGVVIIDLIGFGIVMPILPFWAREYGASATTLGWIAATYAAAQFVFAPLWGALSDRIGRRPVLLGTIAGTTLALALLAVADSIPMLFAARLLAGVFAANFSVASAYVSDVTPPELRTGRMALLGACFAIGFTLGPALAGPLSLIGVHAPIVVAASLSAANLLFAWLRLAEPERLDVSGGADADAPLEAARGPRFAALADPRVRAIALANLAFSLAVTQLESMFQYFMADRFGWNAFRVSMLLVAMAVVMGGVQGGMRRIVPRFGEARLVIAGAALMTLAFALIPEMPSIGLLALPLALSAIGRGIAQPSMMGLVSRAAHPGNRGAVMGTFAAMASLARVFGPIAAGWLYDRDNAYPFWLAAAFVSLVLVVPWRRLSRDLGAESSA
jgi:DHA1 family tetracycline resistance protein-like MFS transporter